MTEVAEGAPKLRVHAGLLIKHKLWAGIGVMLAIVVGFAIIIFASTGETQSRVKQVVDELLPLAESVASANSQLHKTTAQLGFFVLSGAQSHRDSFEAGNARLKKLLGQLNNRLDSTRYPDLRKRLDKINAGVSEL